ncbi:Maf family protein [Chungangia koreensis]|uniref:dTTP/UTP pyrophosphatase n=1 Tax=Chungangia koreensis TaxID=752657 RepID=A0ABV8X725_9LACT
MKFRLNNKLVLASSSPRRFELLSQLGVPFNTDKSEVPETTVSEMQPTEFVQRLALEKAEDVYSRNVDSLIIGADTIVTFEGQILHKPKNAEQAKDYLKRLSGQTHQVHTGVAFKSSQLTETIVSTTYVTFKEIPEQLMDAYIESGDPFDKAGGYGIQTLGGLFVESIEGDYNTVVGLPLASVFTYLYDKGLIQITKGGGEDPA